MLHSGVLIRFDKNDAEFQTENAKNNPQLILKHLPVEKYVELLDAYSLLLFSISGVDFRNYAGVFRPQNRRQVISKFYDCSGVYLEFYKELSRLMLETGKTSPFVMIVLKNYIWSSSELIESNFQKFFDSFVDMKDRFIPKLREYIQGEGRQDYLILQNKSLRNDLEMEIKVLTEEVTQAVHTKTVKDKTIKYDEAVRG